MPTASMNIALERFTTFGDLLKFLRRRAGLTQRELSIAVGYSDAQISRLEQNERLPDVATISARFLPILLLEDQPQVANRLLELASAVRREDAPASGLPPYKGLFYFDESDSDLFFGREKLTASLVERLFSGLEADHRFLTVIGASGSGKSSLVRAGLIPALRWRQESSGWLVYVMTPTAHPLEALAETFNGRVSKQAIIKEFASTAQGLHKYLDRQANVSGSEHALLVIDQFEELFTLCRNEIEQHVFVENVLTVALQPGGKSLVVIAMRADFYAHCAQFDLLRQAVSSYQEYIGPMSMDDLRRVIEEPAKRGHWEIEQGLVEVLLHDVGADAGRAPEPGALPLLSHALLETWQRRRGHTMTLSGYIASGGVRGAIAETAETVFYDKLDQSQRDIARQIFLRLTELGGDSPTADTRRRVGFEELVSKQEDRDIVREVLSTLADARLITTDQDVAEVAHEALIREWPTLRNWLEENREGLRLHRHLTVTAQEWDRSNHDPSILYRGARLAQSLEWASEHTDDLNLLERSFLGASQVLVEKEAAEREAQHQRELESAQKLANTEKKRAEEQTRSNRRLRQRAIVLTTAFVLAGILALVAVIFWQRTIQANMLATSRELSAAAVNNLQIDPERSTLLALQALEISDTLEARNALHQALPDLHLLHTISAHTQAVGVAYSPDGKWLASIDNFDGETKVWDAATFDLLDTLPGEPGAFAFDVAFSPDGKLLATAVTTKVILWDVASGQKLFSLDGELAEPISTNVLVHIAFSPDGKRLAIANMDGKPRVFDLATRTEVLSLVGHTGTCEGIAYSPDGGKLATSDMTGVIKIWDAQVGEELLSLEHGGFIHSVVFSPDDRRLASVSETGTIKVWDAATGNELLRLQGGLSGIYDVAFMPDGKGLVTCGKEGSVRVRDVEFGQEYLTLTSSTSTAISIAVSPDGKRIASSGYDGTIKIWDAAPGREVFTLPEHADIVWDVVYSPDGALLASASQDGKIKIWDPGAGTLKLMLPTDGSIADGFSSIAFSPNGQGLAAGGLNGILYLWDAETGQLEMSLPGHLEPIVDLDFSPDGRWLATGSWDGSAKIWDLSQGKEVLSIEGPWFGVVFSPDGKSVFGSHLDQSVHRWDITTGEDLGQYSGEGRDVFDLAVSPDGKLLAMSRQDGVVILWDVASGSKVKTIPAHGAIVLRVAFNHDGTLLATASFDRLAKVWDVRTGEEVATFFGNNGDVFSVAFSPEGNQLATAGADGTIRTYTLRIDDLIAQAKSRLTRSLTEEECRKYLHMGSCP
jgi:WD40 repeat protein